MLQTVIALIEAHLSQLPDSRKASPNLKYSVRDAALSAFAVFVMQSPSFLAHQRDMERLKGRNNACSLFQVAHIPSDNQIRNILDPVTASALSGLFWQLFAQIEAHGLLATQIGLDNHLLCALDGVYYFSSEQIHCANCTRLEHEGRTRYVHSLIAPVLVAPGVSHVFSLAPEFIQPQDGHDKQDCEQAAVQRWLAQQARHLPLARTTFLADDLHCKQPFCERLLALGSSFILVCLPASHETLYRELALLAQANLLETHQERHWNGRCHELRRYRFTNGVPLRASGDALLVNWCEVTILNEQTGEQIYTNSFVTNHRLTNHTVAEVVRCGRARWKTENENHNTLKNHGYHLEHNFGHGKVNLSAVFVSLNLLAFAFHTVCDLAEDLWRTAMEKMGSRSRFFENLRSITTFLIFPTWDDLLTTLAFARPPPTAL